MHENLIKFSAWIALVLGRWLSIIKGRWWINEHTFHWISPDTKELGLGRSTRKLDDPCFNQKIFQRNHGLWSFGALPFSARPRRNRDDVLTYQFLSSESKRQPSSCLLSSDYVTIVHGFTTAKKEGKSFPSSFPRRSLLVRIKNSPFVSSIISAEK